ncbi:GNAT family N-acetyltransferase [Homoserinimonas sp. A447]
MTSADVTVRRTREIDWEEYRALRLEMLADTPSAFGETLANAGRWGEAEWRMRSARGEASDQILVVAIDKATGRWVGSMGGFVASGPDVVGPLLVGVYVSPDFRGRAHGVASALLSSVEEWAATVNRKIHLHVHEDNPRALAFYERSGYRLTGKSEAYALNPEQRELEMVKELR